MGLVDIHGVARFAEKLMKSDYSNRVKPNTTKGME
jgi:hypothetical protein